MKTKTDKLKWAMNTMRRASIKLGESYAAKVNARVERGRYLCAICGGLFGPKQIHVDHTDPVICPEKGFQDLETWLDRLLPGVEGYQILCTPCHKCKTKEESAIRAKNRRARNNK